MWINLQDSVYVVYISSLTSDLLLKSLHWAFWNSGAPAESPVLDFFGEFPLHSCSTRKLSPDGTIFSVALSSSTYFPYISCVTGPGSGKSSLFFIASSIPFFSFPKNTPIWIWCNQITPLSIAFCCNLPFHRLLEEWTFIIMEGPSLSLVTLLNACFV